MLDTPMTIAQARYATMQALDAEFQRRLASVVYDSRSFDLSGNKPEMVNHYRDGAVETDALMGAGTWVGKSWPYVSDGGVPYPLANVATCRQWALSMFFLYAALDEKYEAHKAAIAALDDIEAARLYDVTSGWSS